MKTCSYNSPTLAAILDLRPNRQQTYGDCRHGFRTIAALWNAYLAGRPIGTGGLNEVDVAVMIGLVKTGRIATGTAHHDNFADAANYNILAGDLAFPKGEQP